jgi:hypothetical protein
MENFTFIAPLAVKQWLQPTLMPDEITAISFAYINTIPIILRLSAAFSRVGSSRGCVIWQGTAGARRKKRPLEPVWSDVLLNSGHEPPQTKQSNAFSDLFFKMAKCHAFLIRPISSAKLILLNILPVKE